MKTLHRLEREYTRVKHKEAEDNEEIRRLKTENRLLMQRVDELEQVTTLVGQGRYDALPYFSPQSVV
jgi:hypothetical protein